MNLTKYTDVNWASDRAKERAGISDTQQDEVVLEMLEDSAGYTPTHPKVYRPYYVAAKLLEQDISKQQLSKAGDVEFTGLVTVIGSLLAQQAGLDRGFALALPPGMEVAVGRRKVRATGSSTLSVTTRF